MMDGCAPRKWGTFWGHRRPVIEEEPTGPARSRRGAQGSIWIRATSEFIRISMCDALVSVERCESRARPSGHAHQYKPLPSQATGRQWLMTRSTGMSKSAVAMKVRSRLSRLKPVTAKVLGSTRDWMKPQTKAPTMPRMLSSITSPALRDPIFSRARCARQPAALPAKSQMSSVPKASIGDSFRSYLFVHAATLRYDHSRTRCVAQMDDTKDDTKQRRASGMRSGKASSAVCAR